MHVEQQQVFVCVLLVPKISVYMCVCANVCVWPLRVCVCGGGGGCMGAGMCVSVCVCVCAPLCVYVRVFKYACVSTCVYE